MKPESIQSWIGLKLGDGSQVVDFVGEGSHYIVFKAVHKGKSYVIKLLRTHIGFTINLPPNSLFPELLMKEEYNRRLLLRLNALCGSQLLSNISPLEELWTAIAVEHLPSFDREAQSIDIQYFNLLSNSQFVRDRLNDWSMADIGKSIEEMNTPIVIYEGDKPIHADPPELLAREAKGAMKELDARSAEKKDSNASVDLEHNPFLPWLSAMATGYVVPVEAVGLTSKALSECDNLKLVLQQAGQVANYLKRNMSQQQKMELINFVLAVVVAISKTAIEDFRMFLNPCDTLSQLG
jgi:hypothetical protein